MANHGDELCRFTTDLQILSSALTTAIITNNLGRTRLRIKKFSLLGKHHPMPEITSSKVDFHDSRAHYFFPSSKPPPFWLLNESRG